MPERDGCFICGRVPTTLYTIVRHRATRHVQLCREHGEPIEAIISTASPRRKVTGPILSDIKDLKPSRATVARALMRQEPQKPA